MGSLLPSCRGAEYRARLLGSGHRPLRICPNLSPVLSRGQVCFLHLVGAFRRAPLGVISKLPGRYAAKRRTGRREACCLRAVWLANPGPQELPDLLGGLGGLGGAEQDLVDVGQALADLQADVDPGVGCCSG